MITLGLKRSVSSPKEGLAKDNLDFVVIEMIMGCARAIVLKCKIMGGAGSVIHSQTFFCS